MEEIKKSCSNCRYSENIRLNNVLASWDCYISPFLDGKLFGSIKEDFETFNCSRWKDALDIKEIE